MFWRGLALATLALHGAFLAYLFVGGWLFELAPWSRWLHVLAIAYSIIITVLKLPCPLTRLEQRFDAAAGRTPYAEDCVMHYLWSHLGLRGTEVWLLGGLLALALGLNLPHYLSV